MHHKSITVVRKYVFLVEIKCRLNFFYVSCSSTLDRKENIFFVGDGRLILNYFFVSCTPIVGTVVLHDID